MPGCYIDAECSRCGGNGYLWSDNLPGPYSEVRDICPECHGVGETEVWVEVVETEVDSMAPGAVPVYGAEDLIV